MKKIEKNSKKQNKLENVRKISVLKIKLNLKMKKFEKNIINQIKKDN